MSNIVDFPPRPLPGATGNSASGGAQFHQGAQAADAPPVLLAHWQVMSLAEIVAHLGYGHHTPRVVVEKLRALHRHSGLPLPKNTRILRGLPCTGADNICRASIWDRGEFLAWLDMHRTPPAMRPRKLADARRTTRHILARRCLAVQAGGGAS